MKNYYSRDNWAKDSIDLTRAETKNLNALKEEMLKSERGLVRIVKLVVSVPLGKLRGVKYNGRLISTVN